MGTQTVTLVTTTELRLVKTVKTRLESESALEPSRRITCTDGVFHIYSLKSVEDTRAILADFPGLEVAASTPGEGSPATRNSFSAVAAGFIDKVADSALRQTLQTHLPKKWSVYPPMVLFGPGSFDSSEWQAVFADGKVNQEAFFTKLRQAFPPGITHFAVNRPIVEHDAMRRPFHLVPLHGDFGPAPSEQLYTSPASGDLTAAFWCLAVQNGITQYWAPRYTMFLRGNITEKKRVLDTFRNAKGQNVVDMYAGIGYFTFSYLAVGTTVFCWEINPWLVEGLVRGLVRNGHRYALISEGEPFSASRFQTLAAEGVKAFVFHELNIHAADRMANVTGTLAHVNLGLLPSLQPSWPTVRLLIRGHRGCAVHVHENVHVSEIAAMAQTAETYFAGRAVHTEKVKTFAPDVWHIVVDVVNG